MYRFPFYESRSRVLYYFFRLLAAQHVWYGNGSARMSSFPCVCFRLSAVWATRPCNAYRLNECLLLQTAWVWSASSGL